ncbi:hypothetical protein [Microbacterium invictum]|uniref:Uncharacterized protein n=1 Tax=Microbacterium invictum TaxID=515415 RepID=A0AA40SLI9_9MICO|nr:MULTISPECIES: hypothetical protein [Microbacterium]MBB4138455.1 hypothetical protein [Microbacterium invictum]
MADTLDVILEVFTWVGFGAAALLGVIAVAMWAADGSWLPADAYVDHEDGVTTVRWFDADGDANSAPAVGAVAATLAGVDRASIWYRHGWHGRMRLTPHAPDVRRVGWAALVLLGVGVLAFAASWVLLFLDVS